MIHLFLGIIVVRKSFTKGLKLFRDKFDFLQSLAYNQSTMKLTIYYGKEEPAMFVGKNQCKLGEFAYEFRGWHSYKPNDRATVRAIKSLVKKGHLQISGATNQFRWWHLTISKRKCLQPLQDVLK